MNQKVDFDPLGALECMELLRHNLIHRRVRDYIVCQGDVIHRQVGEYIFWQGGVIYFQVRDYIV